MLKSGGRAGDDLAKRPGIYIGNNNDLIALAGVFVAGITVFGCCGGFYCLPLAGLLVGLAGWLGAKDALDTQRAKTLSLIAMGVGGALFLISVLGVLAYVALMVSSIAFAGI